MSDMILKKENLFLLLIVIASPFSVYPQETISTSGNEAKGSGGTSSYTVGQTVYAIKSGDGGEALEGIQFPYEIFIITGVDENDDTGVALKAYPNPATDILILNTGSCNLKALFYTLADINGNFKKKKKITATETEIDLKNLPNGSYFLKINDSEKNIKTFKIIKNK